MLRRAAVFFALTLASIGLMPQSAWAAKDPVYQSFLGTAINGTDPVSYFAAGRPIEGKSSISYEWNGATWRFASTENRDRFAANPEKFAPQYGGYCAWAVAKGSTASTDPEAWSIVEGKLYLNYSKSVRKQWAKDIPGNIMAADQNWPDVLK